jgi:TatA/E family protein of Tat protein translocase
MPFGIGPGELIIVLVIALIVVSPGKIPDVGAALGKSIREFRKASTDIQDSVKVDLDAPAPAAAPAPVAAPIAPVLPAPTQAAPVPVAAAPVAAAPVAAAPVAEAAESSEAGA